MEVIADIPPGAKSKRVFIETCFVLREDDAYFSVSQMLQANNVYFYRPGDIELKAPVVLHTLLESIHPNVPVSWFQNYRR